MENSPGIGEGDGSGVIGMSIKLGLRGEYHCGERPDVFDCQTASLFKCQTTSVLDCQTASWPPTLFLIVEDGYSIIEFSSTFFSPLRLFFHSFPFFLSRSLPGCKSPGILLPAPCI